MNRRNRRSESLKTASTSQGRAITALLALTACAFLLAPLPATSQDAPDDPAAQAQDVEMPREVRVLVQRGLAALGFDPGPADGLFGPKTRAAIWDWQAAKELDATSYLSLPEAEALAAIGAEASESLEVEFEEPAQRGQEPESTEVETATAPSGSRNQVLYFPTCGSDDARPDGCWLALSSPAECVMWWWLDHSDGPPLTWSGECDDTSRASGRGTLDWGDRTESGEIVEGKQQGHWVMQSAAAEAEGPFVDGKAHGHWVIRLAVGYVYEGPFVNGLRHGQWRMHYDDGTSKVEEYRHGELVR